MTQYKGYYIDHIYFRSKAEIDAHIKQKAVEEYQRRIRYFADHTMKFEQWNGFYGEEWQNEVNVRQFIQDNYTPYTGDASFLAGPTARTSALMDKLNALLKKESDNGGLLDIDTMTVSSLTSYGAGYLDKENELIVGSLHTEQVFTASPAVVTVGAVTTVHSLHL